MTLEADLARWGEPPATHAEETLAHFLDTVLDRLERGAPVESATLLGESTELLADGRELLRTLDWLCESAGTVLEHSGMLPAAGPDLGRTASWVSPPENPFPGEFRILSLLGRGGFGNVWLADDLNLDRQVALKTLRPPGGSKEREEALKSLRQEARLLASVHHPNVVQVHTWRQAGDDHYLVLQYIAGGSFADRLECEGPLGWQQAARYVADVAEALLEVHAHGIVHRDVKPANVLWDPARDEAVLTDFGLSVRLGRPEVAGGTPFYMAPEAFRGEATAAGDVYGLAATLFDLCTGEVPFPAQTVDELRRRVERGLPDPDPRCAVMPEALERVVRAGLAARPERRPALREFVTALRGSLNQLLGDSLLLPAGQKERPAPVDLRLLVGLWQGGNTYASVAATHPGSRAVLRDLKKVPPLPEQVQLRSGDRVRIQVVADRAGYVTVLNVGPTGNLNLLYPERPDATPAPVEANRLLDILDVELTPPAGAERVIAVWSRAPLALADLQSVVGQAEGGGARPYHATRDMNRVQESVQRLRPEDWHAAVLTLDHEA